MNTATSAPISWDQFLAVELRVGRLVLGVTNFPPKQVGRFMSECLVTGLHDGSGGVALCVPDRPVPLGTRLL